jgi:hypothetical protein
MKTETYICDGRKFKTYDEVLVYCELNNFIVTNTQTIRKNTYLITISINLK